MFFFTFVKGVSDLEKCIDYFALPGRKLENLNLPAVLLNDTWYVYGVKEYNKKSF